MHDTKVSPARYAPVLLLAALSTHACGVPDPENPPVNWKKIDTLRGVDGGVESRDDEILEVLYLVGDHGTLLHHDGYYWGQVPALTVADLLAVAAPSSVRPSQPAVAVGCDAGSSAVILYEDGEQWRLVSQGSYPCLRDVTRTSTSGLIAVGDAGTILRSSDGKTWRPDVSPTTADLKGVAPRPEGAFAVGAGGTILHLVSSAWAAMESPVTTDLYGVSADAGNRAHAVGAGGVILEFADNTGWQPTDSGTQADLFAVHDARWGGQATTALVGGASGTILYLPSYHTAGSPWLRMTANTAQDLLDVWGTSSPDDTRAPLVVGTGRAVLELAHCERE